MAIGIEGRPQTLAVPVDDLVASVLSGQIRIPSFQRGLRWNRSDVLRLFDSIALGYPIGNLLLWQRPAGEVKSLKIGALEIDAPPIDRALFVVDGQQRLTSLANALTDAGQLDNRFAISYDLSKKAFVPTPPASVASVIPLPVVFDLSKLLAWYSEHPELTSEPSLVSRANDVAKAIREYRVPLYVVENSDSEVLRDIFDRMNNYGKQLSRAEIFSALNDKTDEERTTGSSTTDLGSISADVHAATGYGVVDEGTILLAMLARRGADISRDIRREFTSDSTDQEFRGESAEEARRNVTTALSSAIRFLQSEGMSPHFAFLPYRYLLVVLCRFYAHFPAPSAATRRTLRRWFWRAASRGPELTRGNITYATRSLCARIIPGSEQASIAGLIELVGDKPASNFEVAEFRTNKAATRILLSAMWQRKPARLSLAGEVSPYSFDDLLAALGESNSAVNQSVPILTEHLASRTERALPANRVLLMDTAQDLPESAIDTLWQLALRYEDGSPEADILQSHFIGSVAADRLANSDLQGFLSEREAAIGEALKTFLESAAEWKFEDTPSLESLALDESPEDEPWTDE
ncbi:MAG: hypothetical protein JWR04_696 [Rhodoglobus sp.]|nr:hypothetical protein [Rhodoglobus sp.]